MPTVISGVKKVTTYGRKKTQVIAIHSDLETPPPKRSTNIPSPSPISPQPVAKASRRPLQSIDSQEIIKTQPNIPLLNVSPPAKPPRWNAKRAPQRPARLSTPPKSPIKAVSSSPESVVEIVRPVRVRRARRIITRSPSSSVSPAKLRALPVGTPPRSSKPLFEGVEIQTKKRVTSGSSLIAKFSQITIDLTESDESFTTAPETVERVPIEDLLSICTFSRVCPFSGFLSSTAFANLLTSAAAGSKVQKIGEATYSEVFGVRSGAQEVVVKIIPLEHEKTSAVSSAEKDLPDLSSVRDVLKEIETTKHLKGLAGGGFVDYRGAYVVRGVYPTDLLAEWDRFDAEIGSESIRPDAFLSNQRYAIIVLGNGGPDLEAFKFDKAHAWIQAAAVFWQVASALARAEKWAEFEHRDLHEGQVLITTVESIESQAVDYLHPPSTGIQATIIDFGLSRLSVPNKEPIWTAMPPEVYEGVGEQWDTYRAMRDKVTDWEAFNPSTNVLWLRYLLSYILHSKGLRKPRPKSMRPPPRAPLGPSRRVVSGPKTRTVSARHRPTEIPVSGKDATETACEMMLELEIALGCKVKKVKSKAERTDLPFESASALVTWAREHGWLR
ncbi:hypothetical protein BD324DRAFT_624931 [Kockovaella imperatae]|uniref:non-specific serine/threonine protein kinase n=1 Tax=Kockovaella imperatae TaxID=4999 RepID=A0A1Y1UHX6_9TREE|nr:hypothetical protein BD324DRAFT_624931 [Kockovaella imperatae]ORX37137.1 hypothetical protein BD324DRAFT_624931 [Kockovaella imperatae]